MTMDSQNKWLFLRDNALPRMAATTFPYLASVVGVRDRETGVHEGSALRCILSGRRCIVTAFHVMKAISEYAGLAISAGSARPPCLIHGAVHFERHADLAVYPLPDDYPDDPELVRFWS